MLRRQLTSRFGVLPKVIHQYLDQVDTTELEQWAESILNASALEAVFYPAAEQSRHLRDAPHPGQSACPLPPLQLDDLRTRHFLVRVPPETHRSLVMQAAEAGVSLNRLIASKLQRTV